MATIKHIKQSKSKTNIVFIPGGPGLGPISFIPVTEFIDGVNIYLYYPSGTDNQASDGKDFSYTTQLKELKNEIKKIENPIIIGHSFGGIIATDLALQSPSLINSLICIAAPFSKKVFESASEVFNQLQSSESNFINDKFKNEPTDKNYKEWFSFYGELYFSETNVNSGKKMILDDSACAESYLAARSESATKESLLSEIKNVNLNRLFILGEQDKLLPSNILIKDAEAGNYKTVTIKEAGHFVHFDQPIKVAEVISQFIKEIGE